MRAATANAAQEVARAWPALLWLALIVAVAFAQDADGEPIAQAGALGALGLAAIAAAAGLIPRQRALRSVWVAIVALGLLAVVAYLSIAWSLRPEASWLDANRTVGAAAALALGIVIGSLVPRPAETGALVLCLASLPLAGWPIVERTHAISAESARLSGPLGQANALGAFCAIALPAALWLAGGRSLAGRALGGACAVLLVIALALSGSRAGAVAAVAGVACLLLVGRRALTQLVALALALAAAVPVAVWAGRLDAFKAFAPGQATLTTVAAPSSLLIACAGVMITAGAATVAGQAIIDLLSPARARSLTRGIGIGATVCLVGALAALAIHSGGPIAAAQKSWDRVINGGAVDPQSTDRLLNASGDLRGRYWREAVHGFTDQPLRGNGAGTFEAINQHYRLVREQATPSSHSVALQVLSGTGLAGGIPGALALLAALLAAAIGLRRLNGESRAAGAAIAAGAVALALHSEVDIDWSVPALTLCAYPLVGLLASGTVSSSPLARSRRLPALAAALAFAACVPVALPWLSARGINRAEAQMALGTTAGADQARIEADLALRLDPLSVNGLLARASYLDVLGRHADARRDLKRAVKLEPTSLAALQAVAYADENAGSADGAYRRLIRADPVNHESWFAYASYLAARDCARAKKAAARTQELAPVETRSQYAVQCTI